MVIKSLGNFCPTNGFRGLKHLHVPRPILLPIERHSAMHFAEYEINDSENGNKSKTAASEFPAGPEGNDRSPKIIHDVFC